jgi:peptide/nickel transport system permease protein
MPHKGHIRAQSVLAILLILGFVVVAIFAEKIAPTTRQLVDGVQLAGRSSDQQPHEPSPEALLGTTPGQMDIYYALIHGTRDALIFGLTTTLLTALIGLIVGTVGGMGGGWINQLSMRFTDGVLCFPVIAGIAFFQQVIDMTSIANSGGMQTFLISPYMTGSTGQTGGGSFLLSLNPVMLAMIVLCWVPYARTMNVLVLHTKKLEYVTAARAAGASSWRIFMRHILPNTATPLIVLITKDIGQMVVWQTTFAFVGFQNNCAWASPLIISRSWILGAGSNPFLYWWVYIPISLAIILFAFAWNLLGDEINHWLNPRKY